MREQWPQPGGSFRSSNAAPEILPPEYRSDDFSGGYPGGSAVPSRPSPGWAIAPATYVLVGINCGVFLLMVLSGVPLLGPSGMDLIRWGANDGLAVLHGEAWRLFTATFVHIGLVHLLMNMWCLWNLGLLGEPLLGPAGTVAVYVLTGVAGNLLSVAVHPGVIGAGASGAIFGLAGVLILLLRSDVLPMDPIELRRLRRSVIYFAAMNFVIGAGTLFLRTGPRIDNMAHLGGFLCGLAMGVPLVPRIGSSKKTFVTRQWLVFTGTAMALLLAESVIGSLQTPPGR